ncbi:ABC transporter ATP-binding protein [Pseudalkalibacillus salsuginis]|uniref:ABC transporter ATP-binding protein n=1 Tax=Pseudalkalibacillus salsuginis TaxID=2910972 RepID=UPI001F1F70B8|nr:ABC transporter ATP-binding protein [Pseudalkalibacillus salsuginis]MCF6411048.1 ABC transporter ATP-binding protein [Pseudalkalibacillus salsuginis]
MKSVLDVTDLTGGYSQQQPVLHNLNFHVEQKEIVGLIGLNGAGKSTTIKHVLGLMEPIEGTIKVSENTIGEGPDRYRSQIAYIPETPVLYDELTLWEHLELTAMAYDIDQAELKSRVEPLLKEFRMENKLKWFPNQFSKGMKQKVMIMCAFLVRPSLFVVDEPFVGLDPLGIQSFLDLIVQVKERGTGILLSTHILSTAERYCDRFIILHEGRILADGTLAEIQAKMSMPNAALDEIYVQITRGA